MKLTRRTYGQDLHRMLDDWGKTWGATERQGDTIGAALDAYLGQLAQRLHKNEIAASTVADYHKHIAKVRPVFGHVRLCDVDGPMLEKWKAFRGAQSQTQFNHERTVLFEAFKVAIRRGMTTTNPVENLPPEQLKPRDRYVSTQEANFVLGHANRAVQAAAVLAASTGLRQGDILRLRRSDFSDSGLTVMHNKTRSKTRKAMHYPWSEGIRIACELAARKVVALDGHWLTRRDGKPYTSDGFRSMWDRAMKKAMRADPALESFHFHDLRAKAGTDGTDPGLLGHLDPRTFSRVYDRKPRTVKPAR